MELYSHLPIYYNLAQDNSVLFSDGKLPLEVGLLFHYSLALKKEATYFSEIFVDVQRTTNIIF
jgi:hypothetical protein